MRRKDRQITDAGEVLDVLRRCDTIRIGMFCGEYPYIVPVSFGLDARGDRPVVYFHSAAVGLKADCIRDNSHVCVEADILHKIEPMGAGITARYESVIGHGTASEVHGDEKLLGLRCIVEHYGYGDFPVEGCANLSHTAVYKIVLDELTGKRNLPSD